MGGDIYADNENTNTLRFSKFLLERRGQKSIRFVGRDAFIVSHPFRVTFCRKQGLLYPYF